MRRPRRQDHAKRIRDLAALRRAAEEHDRAEAVRKLEIVDGEMLLDGDPEEHMIWRGHDA